MLQSHVRFTVHAFSPTATAILSASFNLLRDSLSNHWCVLGREFRNAKAPPSDHVQVQEKQEKESRVISSMSCTSEEEFSLLIFPFC